MSKLINPLFPQQSGNLKITASVSPLSNQPMTVCKIVTKSGLEIPVECDLENRIVLPVKKSAE